MSSRIKHAKKIDQGKDHKIWQRNLIALEQYHPGLARDMKALGTTGQPDAPYQVKTSQSGLPTLLSQRASGDTIHLHSAYDPMVEARHWAENAGKENWQVCVIFGLGLGYHIDELQRLYPERSIVVVEPLLDIFNKVAVERDLRSFLRHPNFSIVANKDVHAAASKLFENHLRSAVLKGQIAFLSWPPYQRIWPAFWQELQQQVGEMARQANVNLGTYQYFSMQWQENFFTNLRASVTDPSVKSLYPLFRGKPAILVSAGPSLQKNIHLLAEAKEKALIVAAGSAIGPLLAHGIKPHLVMSFDGSAANYYVFSNLDTRDLVLVYSSVIYPRIIAEYQGPRFALGVDIYPFERWFFEQIGHDRGSVASGPSIANLTWDFLRQMACDPIIFVGQDLAYGDDGQTHAAGHVELERETKKPESAQANRAKFEWVEDVWGNQVRTTSVWLTMKIWFEQRIRAWGKGHTFIDATEGGAKIVGTQIMSLREALDVYCRTHFDAQKLILETHQRQTMQIATQNIDEKLNLVLHQIEQEFDKMLRICADAVDPLRELDEINRSGNLKPNDFARFHAIFSRLDIQLAESDVYKYFVTASMQSSRSAFDAMSARLRAETELGKRGKQLVDLYAALFATVRKAITDVKSYRQLAADNLKPYAPPNLAAEINDISSTFHQMHPLVDRLKHLSTLSVDEAIGVEATALHDELERLFTSVNSTEIMRWFIKEILEQDTPSVHRLQVASASVNRESDLTRKAGYLATYHSLRLHIMEDALAKVRMYSHTIA